MFFPVEVELLQHDFFFDQPAHSLSYANRRRLDIARALVDELYARGVDEVWNLYGPSEDTTYSTAGKVSREPGGPVTSGRPP